MFHICNIYKCCNTTTLFSIIYNTKKKGHKMSEKIVVCEEIIKSKPSGCYSIRVDTDCSPLRFIKIREFDTFEEADAFAKTLPRKHVSVAQSD